MANSPARARKITLGRRCRSETLLVYGTSRLVTNTNRYARLAAMRLRKLAARLAQGDSHHDAVEPAVQIGQVLLQRCRPPAALVVVRWRWRHAAAVAGAGAEFGIAALHAVACIAQQMRQTHLPLHRKAALAAQHKSDTQTSGLDIAPNRSATTALPRLGRIVCSTASVPMNTHSHQVLPLTRAEASSEQTTGLASTVSRIVAAAASSGCARGPTCCWIAPSLMLSGEDLVHQGAASCSMPMAWA